MGSHSGTRAATGRLAQASMDSGSKWQMAIVTFACSLPAAAPTHAKRDSPKTRPRGRSVGTHLGSFPGRPSCWGWKRKRKGQGGGGAWKASFEVSTPGLAHMRQSSIVPHSHLPPHGSLPPCLEALLNGGQLITSRCPTLGPFSFPDPPHSQSRAASAPRPRHRPPSPSSTTGPSLHTTTHHTGSFLKHQT